MSDKPKTGDPTGSNPRCGLSLVRLERLADIIFGVAFLLLLVTIDFAEASESDDANAAYSYLWGSVSQNLGFIISFLAVAYYWLSHQQCFSHYRRTNKAHTIIELLYLMTIAGMPVNNHFIAVFPSELAPRLAISSDIFLAGMLAFWSWCYASKNNRLIDPSEVSAEKVAGMKREALVMPCLGLLAAGAAFLHPFAWDLVLFVGPILALAFLNRAFRHQ